MTKKTQKNPLDGVSLLILTIGGLLCRTWRYSFSGGSIIDLRREAPKARIFSLWHAHLLPLSFAMRNTGITVIVSPSRDGERIASVLSRWRYEIIHGSSSRGGMAALRAGVTVLREGKDIAITPDGPLGPRNVVKPGVAQIALLSGAPIIPIAAKPKAAWYLNSWDRFMIPKPFTRITVQWRDPIVPSDSDNARDSVHLLTAQIQEIMNAC